MNMDKLIAQTNRQVSFIERFVQELKAEQAALSGLRSEWTNVEKTAKAQGERVSKSLGMVENLLDIIQGKK